MGVFIVYTLLVASLACLMAGTQSTPIVIEPKEDMEGVFVSLFLKLQKNHSSLKNGTGKEMLVAMLILSPTWLNASFIHCSAACRRQHPAYRGLPYRLI